MQTLRSEVSDFYSDAEIEKTYNLEVQELVAKATGAKRVFVFDHTRRSDSQKMQSERTIREPAWFVHNDYTERSARRRVRDFLGEEADELLKRRFAIINVWRSMAGTVESTPLAMCDARSIDASDLVASERRAKDHVGEVQQALHSERQRWVCFPQMSADEALLIKVFDAVDDGRAQSSIHSAFVDPATPEGAPPRESIETRTFVFF